MSTRFSLFGLTAGFSILGALSLHATPIVQFNFNETGTTAASTGSVTGISATMYTYTSSLVATDLHTAAGTGVAGDLVGSPLFGIDRAFNASAGIALNTTTTALSGLQSWTVSGWYKPTASLVPGSAFFQTPGDNGFTSDGLAVRAADMDDLRVGVVGTSSPTVPTAVNKFDPIGTWVFFAVTYDGTQTSSNVKVYEGFRSGAEAVGALGAGALAPATLVSTLTANAGTPLASIGFSLGARLNSTNYIAVMGIIQSMPAIFDDFRVDGATSDSSGALSQSAIEAYRASDVALVPEPGAGMLSCAGVILLLGVRRRRHAC